jgi:hypothetical protein
LRFVDDSSGVSPDGEDIGDVAGLNEVALSKSYLNEERDLLK